MLAPAFALLATLSPPALYMAAPYLAIACPNLAATLVLRLQICGRLAIALGDLVVDEARLAGRQGRRLWAYLVLNRERALSRDELAGAVWRDDVPDAWDSALSALASRIRSALKPITDSRPALQIHRETGRYALSTPADVFVDHERARAAMHRAELASRRSDAATTWTEARVALQISLRGFLPGDDAEWIVGQRRLLAENAYRALELIAEADLSRGRSEDAAAEARQLVELDPVRESGYRTLMRALAARGDRAEAARAMERCRATLRRIAAVAPSAETERVYHDVMSG
jgi:DNA-binding SARP family transcriptional activator